jgi:glutamyl/glutaminyl-tRNA synthetase
MTCVTRIAPSPTGLFHIGTARTALFNFLYARHYGGKFLVRIEDTDRARSKKEYEENILTGLVTLGLTHDTLFRQSEHLPRHIACLERLVQEDKAYISREPAKEDATHMVEVVRLRNAGKTITFHDEIRGDITFDTTELGDMVIARNMQDPLYHFAVVVDDFDEGVTHVIRGEDHISNTPRQILIQEALGFPRPTYAHLPLILAPDRSKMSKRKGAVAVSDYLHDGILPSALINYLALLGWNPKSDRELYFSLEELVQDFSLEGLQKSGAVFSLEKLLWFNKEHRVHGGVAEQERTAHALADYLTEKPALALLAPLVRNPLVAEDMLERYPSFRLVGEAIEQGEFDFYRFAPAPSSESLVWKKDTAPERVGERLAQVYDLLTSLSEDAFTRERLQEVLADYLEKEGKGNVLWPLRVALSGKEKSPEPFLLAHALGKKETLSRIAYAKTLFVA